MKDRIKAALIKVPTELRVVEPGSCKVCVKGSFLGDYATMCGLTADAHWDIKYGTRRKVTCQACIEAIIHASQYLVVDHCRIEVTDDPT